MNTISSLEIRFIDNTVCEIETLKKGEITCANRMLTERIEAKNRLRAMQCLIDAGDSQYDDIISYLYEQCKEMANRLTTKI